VEHLPEVLLALRAVPLVQRLQVKMLVKPL
jgi:hypothetical protein